MIPFKQLVTFLLLGATLAGCSNEARADVTPAVPEVAQASTQDARTQQVIIPIEGMSCDSCAAHLQQQLARIDGVLEAAVDFDKSVARLKFEPTKVALAKLVAEINKAFTAGEPREGSERS